MKWVFYLLSLLCCSGQITLRNPSYIANVLKPASGITSVDVSPAVLQAVSTSSSLAGAMQTSQVFTNSLPSPFQAGNTVVLSFNGGLLAAPTPTVGDDVGNKYYMAVSNIYNAQWTFIFYATNVTAGGRMLYVTNSGLNANNISVQAAELCGVVGPDVVSANTTTNATVTAGSFTPSVTGDLIWQVCHRYQNPTNKVTYAPGSQGNITWKLLTTDSQDGNATQWGIYNSTSALNPTMSMSDSQGFLSAAVAFKPSTLQGSARPSGIYICGVHHYSQPMSNNAFGASAILRTNVLQVPYMGNLLVQAYTCAGGSNAMVITNALSPSNTWVQAGVANIKGNAENSQFWLMTNVIAAPTFFVTNFYKSVSVSGSDGTVLFYDIAGAQAVPFDNRQTSFGNQSVAGNITAPGLLVPASAGCLVIGQFQQNAQTVKSESPLLMDQDYYEFVTGAKNMDQNGGWGHYHTPDTTAVNPTWTFGQNAAANSWSADTISLLPSTASAGSSKGSFVFVRKNVIETAAGSGTTIATNLTGVTAGHLIVLFVKHEGAATTITASDGTTSFTGATIIDHSNNDLHSRMLYLLSSVASGTVTYTVTLGASRPYKSLHVWEYSYTGTCVFDSEPTGGGGTGTTPGSSTTITTGNITTTGTFDVMLCGYGAYSGSPTGTPQIMGITEDNDSGVDGINCQSFDYSRTGTIAGGGSLVVVNASAAWNLNLIAFKTQ